MDPSSADAMTEAAALRIMLDEHPAMLTPSELELRLLAGDRSAAAVDAVARALRELVAFGLARRVDGHLIATRAAVRFDSLPLP